MSDLKTNKNKNMQGSIWLHREMGDRIKSTVFRGNQFISILEKPGRGKIWEVFHLARGLKGEVYSK